MNLSEDHIKETKQPKKLTKLETLKIIFHILTMTELIYLQKMEKYPQKLDYFLQKIRMSNLCSENIYFFITGLNISLEEYIQQQQTSIFMVITILFSFTSSIMVIFQLQMERIKTHNQYKTRKKQDFTQFPIELQLFLSDPSTLPFLKFTYNPKKDYLNLIKNNQNPLDHSDFLQKKNKTESKIPLYTQIYLLIFIIISVFEDVSLFVLLQISSHFIEIEELIILGLLFNLPMIFTHIKLLKNNHKITNNFLKNILNLVYGIIRTLLVSAQLLLIPFVTYEIPFIKETKETWKYNYYSTGYRLMVQFLIQSYSVYFISDVMLTGKNYNSDYLIKDPSLLKFIIDKNSPIRFFYIVSIILYIFLVLFKIMYIFDKFRQYYHEKNQKQLQKQEKLKLQLENESNRSQNTDFMNIFQKSQTIQQSQVFSPSPVQSPRVFRFSIFHQQSNNLQNSINIEEKQTDLNQIKKQNILENKDGSSNNNEIENIENIGFSSAQQIKSSIFQSLDLKILDSKSDTCASPCILSSNRKNSIDLKNSEIQFLKNFI